MAGNQILSILVHALLLRIASAELAAIENSKTAIFGGSSFELGADDASLSLAQLRARRALFDEDGQHEEGHATGSGTFRVVHNVNVTDLALQPVTNINDLPELVSKVPETRLMSHLRRTSREKQVDWGFKLEMYVSEIHHFASSICGVSPPFHFATKLWVEDLSTGCTTHVGSGDYSETYEAEFLRSANWYFEKIGWNPQMTIKLKSWAEEPLLGGEECAFDDGDWCDMFKSTVISASSTEVIDTWIEEKMGSEEEGHYIVIRYKLSILPEIDYSQLPRPKLAPPLDSKPFKKPSAEKKTEETLESPFSKIQEAIVSVAGSVLDPNKPWFESIREEMNKDSLIVDILKVAVKAVMSEDPKEEAALKQSIVEMVKEDLEYRKANNLTAPPIATGLLEPANPFLQHHLITQPAPVGTCSIYGDPHVMGFDHTPIKPVVSLLDVGSSVVHDLHHEDLSSNSGDFWLVRSRQVHIQGRFNKVEEGRLFLRGLAVSGPFLKGNVLLISGNTGGKAFWNKRQILNGSPSEFTSEGLVSAWHRAEKLVQDPSRVSALPGYDIEFPLGVKLLVNRGNRGLGVKITMPKLVGHQDGQCGNFNGDGKDDTPELINARITIHDLLFQHHFAKIMTDLNMVKEDKIQGPLKTCTIYGNTRIAGFDKIEELNQSISGDVWIVNHDLLQIQGRFYGESNRTQRSFLKKLAISGPLLEDGTLFIGTQAGSVFWNNEEILTSIPSEFSNHLIHAKYNSTHPSPFTQIDIELPLGVNLLVTQGKDVLSMKIRAPVKDLSGKFDGQCGNAKGGMRVKPTQLLFHKRYHPASNSSSLREEDEHQIL